MVPGMPETRFRHSVASKSMVLKGTFVRGGEAHLEALQNIYMEPYVHSGTQL